MASNTRVRAQEVVYTTDPSALTTDAIAREVSIITRDLDRLREDLKQDLSNRAETRRHEADMQDNIFVAKLDAIQREFDAKIISIDNATDLRLGAILKIPADIATAIDHHEAITVERFKSIALQFNERDIRTEQAGKASTEALAAALQAAKELVGAQGEASAAAAIKSETSFTKQIDQIGTIIQTLEKALDARITELKERIDRGEGNTSGAERANDHAQEAANALLLKAINEGNAKRGVQSNQIAAVGAILIMLSILIPILANLIAK